MISMVDDIETYEKNYLERFKKQKMEEEARKTEQRKQAERMKQARHEAKQKEQKRYASQTTFAVWDYVLLESIRREDMRIRIRMGTMKTLASLEKLSYAGWIERPVAKMPFDDMERLEAFRDSYEYKQYKDRLDRIMSYEDHAKKSRVFSMLGIKKIDDWLILTEEGRRVAEEHRSKMRLVWDKLRKLYLDKSSEFQQAAENNMKYFPLFFVMGYVNGAMMAQMMSDAHIDYPYWYGDLYGGESFSTLSGSGGFDGDVGGGFDGDPDFSCF